MGWERKRGKLVELNQLLRGKPGTSFIPAGDEPGQAPDVAAPHGVRYVLTVDADTRLPMNIVNRLVGTAAHPLNRPRFDADERVVVKGYGIMQPRVTPLLPERAEDSLYQEIDFAKSSRRLLEHLDEPAPDPPPFLFGIHHPRESREESIRRVDDLQTKMEVLPERALDLLPLAFSQHTRVNKYTR